MNNYSGSSFTSEDGAYWSGELRSTGIHYYPNLQTGENKGNAPDVAAAAVCRRPL